MFNLNSSLFSGSVPWDTNFARIFLQISKDQLEKLNKIPGWYKTGSENDKTLENINKQLGQQITTSTESNLTTKTDISSKNNNSKIESYNSDLHLKQKPLTEKDFFLKTSSLSLLKENNASVYPLKRSNSLPDLHQDLLLHSKSDKIYRTHSLGKDISSSRLAPLPTKNHLNETYTVPLTSDDKLIGINRHKSVPCLIEQPKTLLKQKQLKTLDDNILNHKYLKGIETSVDESAASPLSSNIQAALKKELNLFEKKLLLLEKRLSPSKEMSTIPFNAKLINIENLNCVNKRMSVSASDEVVAVVGSDSVESVSEKVQNSLMSKNYEPLEPLVNSQTLKEKNAMHESNKDKTLDISKTTDCNCESLLSSPIPCGQPVPTEVSSPSQLFPSQESAKLNTLSKLQNNSPPGQSSATKNSSSKSTQLQESTELNTPSKIQTNNLPIVVQPVPCGQYPSNEFSPVTHPVSPKKLAKLNTPSESQNAEINGNILVPEKTSGTFSVFSACSNDKKLTTSKESGTKRKRRIRSERSSRKLDVKKIKRVNIQFSSAQVKNMIEIMKIFHTDF